MEEVSRTKFASRGVQLSLSFHKRFREQKRLRGFHVEVAEPEERSTAGGVRAVLHIQLIPESDAPILVIGSIDCARNQAELRSFAHLAAVHAQRFKGAELPFSSAEYGALIGDIRAFAGAQRLKVRVTEAPDSGGDDGSRSLVRLLAIAFIGVALLLLYLRTLSGR